MKTTSAFRRAGLVMAAACIAVASSAHAAEDSGQVPPPESKQAEQKPEEPKCITDKSGFFGQDGRATFIVELTNVCQSRMKCTINAYIVNAFGPTKAQGTVVVDRKGNNASATTPYVIKLKAPNGSATVSYKCVEI